MITDQRKISLNKLAVYIAENFNYSNLTLLEQIAKSEDVFYYCDHYENIFDGMLLYDDKDFHIHINLDRGNNINSKRGRFTFAHELAHYFIDEHRIGLKSGHLAPHGSLHDFEHKDLIEEEADYFAGCLLMPDHYFRQFKAGRKFSLDTILKLSEAFQASILSTVLRFAEVGTYGITAIISENNIVKWYAQSKEFPKWAFRFKVGKTLPPLTVAGEFFMKKDAKYTGVEDVDPDDWFYSTWVPKTQMHEQCYYSESYGYVISLIWFD